jgi:hypothetical protein
MPKFPTQWHRMKEIVILSLNVIYIKDTLQFQDRFRAKLQYLNISEGSEMVTQQALLARKRILLKRIKDLLEELMNSSKDKSDYSFNIDWEHASLTMKQLSKGYALYTNVRDTTYALNLRNGMLLPIDFPESTSGAITDTNLRGLEYTAQHDGSVLKYFDIDPTDPLKNELRY